MKKITLYEKHKEAVDFLQRFRNENSSSTDRKNTLDAQESAVNKLIKKYRLPQDFFGPQDKTFTLLYLIAYEAKLRRVFSKGKPQLIKDSRNFNSFIEDVNPVTGFAILKGKKTFYVMKDEGGLSMLFNDMENVLSLFRQSFEIKEIVKSQRDHENLAENKDYLTAELFDYLTSKISKKTTRYLFIWELFHILSPTLVNDGQSNENRIGQVKKWIARTPSPQAVAVTKTEFGRLLDGLPEDIKGGTAGEA